MAGLIVAQDSEALLALEVKSPGTRNTQVEPEDVMRGLIPDRHPIALELAAGPQGKRFIVRGTTLSGIQQVEMQLRKSYPEIETETVFARDDPLHLEPDEDVSVAELVAEGKDYRLLQAREDGGALQQGFDLLNMILEALRPEPEDLSAVIQIGLMPEQSRRLRTLLHKELRPLPQTQAPKKTASSGDGVPSWFQLTLMAGGLVLVLLFRAHPELAPPWAVPALSAVVTFLRNEIALPRSIQLQHIIIASVVLAGVLILFRLLVRLMQKRKRRSLEDPLSNINSMVEEKVDRGGYRVAIRFYVFSPRYLPQGENSEEKRAGNLGEWQVLRRERYTRAGQRLAVLQRLVTAYRKLYMTTGGNWKSQLCNARESRALLRSWNGKQGWTGGIFRSKCLIIADALVAFWPLTQTEEDS